MAEIKQCHKPKFQLRVDARNALLEFWRKGNFRWNKTYWCKQCKVWHLSTNKSGADGHASYNENRRKK
jgi:hypothetical protein